MEQISDQNLAYAWVIALKKVEEAVKNVFSQE